MSYTEHWYALATRIKGLRSAGELYALFQSYHQEDTYAAGRELAEQCRRTAADLQQFGRDFTDSLPPQAKATLDSFLRSRAAQATSLSEPDQRVARGALVALAALEAEITFILSGRQEQIRARSERAFMLLQRTLAVDEDVRTKWQRALEDGGETACERLGSIHLLSQGIYAFKVNSEGARTDLVFPEPPDEAVLSRSVDGLVLTEWKKAATTGDAAAKLAQARDQAKRYRHGPLAGLELTGYRYLVVVSERELLNVSGDGPNDGGVVYRHVNIVVNPVVPSKAARTRRERNG
jgi:hypothetical protein